MHIYCVKVKKLQDGYLIIKLIEGQSILTIDHLSFLQLVIDQNGQQTGQYIQTIQVFFPGKQHEPIDAEKIIYNQLAPQIRNKKVTQVLNMKRLYKSPLIQIVEQQIKQRYK